MDSFIIKGDIAYSISKDELITIPDGYLIVKDGICQGAFEKLPEEFNNLKVLDYSGKLIMPGMIDLHIHAPQYAFHGTAMDLELIDWLNRYTFPTEAKFSDLEFARKAYTIFADSLRKSATTRAVIFATRHRDATVLLMDLMEKTGLISYVGKINMDRQSIPELEEKSFADSAFNTFGWINETISRYKNTHPILTPRFVPSCSDKLFEELREIQKAYDIPVQSHLSENQGEVEWIKELCPEAKFYGDAYDRWGLMGNKTIMAHCVYSTEMEIKLMKEKGVTVAHCPSSNLNLSSGIAPIRKYLEEGLNIGLGSDVAGGENESIFMTAVDAIKSSKMYWRYLDNSKKPLSFKEAFYLATMSGGKFFGKVGSFKKGYEFDAIVLDDSSSLYPTERNIEDRLESAFYNRLDMTGIVAKFVKGKSICLK